MSDIESLEEGGSFMDAADDILGLNHPMRDAEIGRLRQAWIAGRDWAATHHEAAAAPSSEARLREALQKAIRSHENLLDLRAIPDSFRPECRRIIAELQDALAHEPTAGGPSPCSSCMTVTDDHGDLCPHRPMAVEPGGHPDGCQCAGGRCTLKRLTVIRDPAVSEMVRDLD